MGSTLPTDTVLDQEGSDAPSPKRACVESGSVLLERNCFTPPAKERLYSLKSKFHPLQSSFARSLIFSPVQFIVALNYLAPFVSTLIFFKQCLLFSILFFFNFLFSITAQPSLILLEGMKPVQRQDARFSLAR